MAKQKKQEEQAPGSPAWMATFGDLMNLLLCFFVLLFSMSTVDAEKYEQLVSSFSSSFGIFTESGQGIGDGELISNGASQLANLDNYYTSMGKAEDSENPEEEDPLKEYEKQMQEKKEEANEEIYENVKDLSDKSNLSDFVDIKIGENHNYVRIVLNGAILFRSGDASIMEEAKPILNKVGDILKVYDKFLIKIEGHTDNVQITNNRLYKNNVWLSSARASTVLDYLIEKKGLDPKTLESAGRGEHDPIASNKTEQGRSRNRRVEIKIYNQYSD